MKITATEMVGVPFSTKEVHRLLDAIADGKLGPPEDPENVTLLRKLGVLLQVATATENRRAAQQDTTPDPAREHARRRVRARLRKP